MRTSGLHLAIPFRRQWRKSSEDNRIFTYTYRVLREKESAETTREKKETEREVPPLQRDIYFANDFFGLLRHAISAQLLLRLRIMKERDRGRDPSLADRESGRLVVSKTLATN